MSGTPPRRRSNGHGQEARARARPFNIDPSSSSLDSNSLRTLRRDEDASITRKRTQVSNLSEWKEREGKIQSLRQQRNQARDQRNVLDKEVDQLKAKLRATVSKLTVASEERDESDRQAQAAATQLQDLSQKLVTQDSKVKSLRRKLDRARDQRDVDDKEARGLKDMLKAAVFKTAAATRERDEGNERFQALAAHFDEQHTTLSLVSQKCASLESDIKCLRRKCSKVGNDRDEAQRRGEETGRELKAALERTAVAKQKLDKANRNIDKITAHFQAQHEELSHKFVSQGVELKALSEDLEEATQQLTRSRVKRCKLQDRIDDLENTANQKDARIESVSARLKQSDEALHSIQIQNLQLSSNLNLKALNVNVLLEKLDQTKRQLAEKSKEVDGLREKLSLLETSSQPSVGLPAGVVSREPSCVTWKSRGDGSTPPVSDLTLVADDVQEPGPIHLLKRGLQHFNDFLSETAAILSVRVEPKDANTEQETSHFMTGNEDANRCRSRDGLMEGFPLTLLEYRIHGGTSDRFLPLTQFVIQHFLTQRCKPFLEGRELDSDTIHGVDENGTDAAISDLGSRANISAHMATVGALNGLTSTLSLLGLTMRGNERDTDDGAYKLMHALVREAYELCNAISGANLSGCYRIVLPCPGDTFSEDEMWDVGDQFLGAIVKGAECMGLIDEGTVAGAVGFGFQIVTPGGKAELSGVQVEIILEPHVVLDSTVRSILG